MIMHETIGQILFSLPRFHVLNYLKASYLRLSGAKVGRRVTFYPGVWIAPGRGLEVEDDVDFAVGVVVTTAGGVTIGERTLIGYRAQIISANHRIPEKRGKIFRAGHEKDFVRIGRDAWIGANAIILPGVEVGEGSVVAAGSVVTKSVEAFSIVAGCPARVIKKRV